MFNKRLMQKELIDEGNVSKSELIQNLKEFEVINRLFGTKSCLIKALNYFYKSTKIDLTKRKIAITDLGCGAGDLLKVMYLWGVQHNIDLNLKGIDHNPEIIHYANEQTSDFCKIHYETLDILSNEFTQYQHDIVCLNNVCHHIDDEDLENLIKLLVKQTRYGIIINDLHRHIVPYYFIKLITKLFGMSSLAKIDGPRSVLKGFQKQDFKKLFSKINIDKLCVKIHWQWPFRWLVIIEAKELKGVIGS